MENEGKKSRPGSVMSLPTAGVILLFFFLPWLKITCQGIDLAKASGLQLTTGKISLSNELGELQKGSGDMKVDTEKDPKPRPWFALGVLLPLLVLGVAALGVKGKLGRKAAGKTLVVLGALGVLLMICATQVDYVGEMEEPESTAPESTGPPDSPDAALEGATGMLEKAKPTTEPTEFLWLTLLLYGLVATGGLMEIYGKR